MQKEQVITSIRNAVSERTISSSSAETLIEQLDDIAAAGARGVDVNDVDSDEVTLVAAVIDASGSMMRYRQQLIEAYNDHFLAPLSKTKSDIFISTWIFNASGRKINCSLLHGYKKVQEADRLNPDVYSPGGDTPLNASLHKAITGLVSYGQTLRDNGTRTKCIVVVFSDGEENASGPDFTSAKIKNLAEDLLSQEIYVLSYCYFGDSQVGDRYAEAIGFPGHHRISAAKSDQEIRKLFGAISSSIISVSKSSVSSGSISSNSFV